MNVNRAPETKASRLPWPFTVGSIIGVAALMVLGTLLGPGKSLPPVGPISLPAQTSPPALAPAPAPNIASAARPVAWVPRCYRRMRRLGRPTGLAPGCVRAPASPRGVGPTPRATVPGAPGGWSARPVRPGYRHFYPRGPNPPPAPGGFGRAGPGPGPFRTW